MSRVIAITSGKGGVGKSNFVLNVGICLAMMEHRVKILDADLGLANIDVLLGLRAERTLEDVVYNRAEVRDIILKTDYRVDLIPGCSGTQDMADLKKEQIQALVNRIVSISKDADFLLVDTASGISTGVVSFLLASPEVIVGVVPEPTSITDAYAMIKVLKKNNYQGRISLFSSMVKNSSAGHALYKKIASASQRFLDTHVEYLGCIYVDEKLSKAVSDQVSAVVRYPTSDISRCYRVIALTILGQSPMEADQEKFWSRLISMITKVTKPKIVQEIPFKEGGGNGSIESAIHDILSEQRKTRMLLEKLVARIEQDIA
ncbi:MAG TPA: MinD/ParA family protein [Deltaproteobacteria bacterium]|nr:MinD/ParA family protein [Deltaproteobacteria bacterium]